MVMKLYYSQNSPYARIARIAVLEANLSTETELIKVINRSPDSPLLEHSPVCRVPTLVIDNLVIGEARNICAYLGEISGKPQFLHSGKQDWQAISDESMVIGFLDGIASWVREGRRDDKSDHHIEVEQLRAVRCLDYFETKIIAKPLLFQDWNFANIALTCALDLMDFHNFLENWQTTSSDLGSWYKIQSNRSSMAATMPSI